MLCLFFIIRRIFFNRMMYDERTSNSTFDKINIFILSHRMTESKFVYDQIFYICFRKLSVFVFSFRYSRVIM